MRSLYKLLILSSILFIITTCEDKKDKFGSIEVSITTIQGNRQNNRTTEIFSSNITKVTISISGVEPVNVDISSVQTLSETINGVPVGEQTVRIDLKNSNGMILYTQIKTVNVEAGQTSSPSFLADDFDAENVVLEVTSPIGGEEWYLGSMEEITWTTSHSSEDVSIMLYKAGNIYQILKDSIKSTGTFNWGIATDYQEGNDYTIRISSFTDLNIFDESDGDFTLSAVSQPASITVTSPNGEEDWELGSTNEITWSSVNVSGNVKIELYKSGSVEETLSSDESNDGSYSWNVSSELEEGIDYRVKVSSVSDGSVYDESDSEFTLSTPPPITIISPNGGEEWGLGSTQDITWSSVNVSGNVKIELYKAGDVEETLSSDESNDGSFSWTVSSELEEGIDYRIRISSLENLNIYDDSDNDFILSMPPSISVTSPNGGEEWGLGSTQDITWSSVNVSGNVKIELYKSGNVEETLSSDESNDGSFSWNVSSELEEGIDYRIRISSLEDLNIYDESDQNFFIGVTTVTDIDGNVYLTVIIGQQEWMAENLRVIHYNNGDSVQLGPDDDEWFGEQIGRYAIYNNDSSNFEVYGNLYNYYAIIDERGLCPDGWHPPSDSEWMELEMELGMSSSVVDDIWFRGTDEGSQLAGSEDLWDDGNLENNEEFGTSGFNVLPGGRRGTNMGPNAYYGDEFMGTQGWFWTSTSSAQATAWRRTIEYNDSRIYRSGWYKTSGFSCRCVKD